MQVKCVKENNTIYEYAVTGNGYFVVDCSIH